MKNAAIIAINTTIPHNDENSLNHNRQTMMTAITYTLKHVYKPRQPACYAGYFTSPSQPVSHVALQ
jgi:hypothetical protein